MTSPESEHAHRWLLGTPVNGISEGTCRHCGVQRNFGKAENENYGNFSLYEPRPKPPQNSPQVTIEPSRQLISLVQGLLSGEKNKDIAKRLNLSMNGLTKLREKEFRAIGIKGNSKADILGAVKYLVGNDYINVPEVENQFFEDTEIVALDMLVMQPAISVSLELSITPAHFEKVMNPTFDKLRAKNSLEAAAIWYKEGQKTNPNS